MVDVVEVLRLGEDQTEEQPSSGFCQYWRREGAAMLSGSGTTYSRNTCESTSGTLR